MKAIENSIPRSCSAITELFSLPFQSHYGAKPTMAAANSSVSFRFSK